MKNLLSLIITIIGCCCLFTGNGQTPSTALSHTELYSLPENTTLSDLPLDSVLVKLDDAIRKMTGERDALIKADLWKVLKRAKATDDPMTIAKIYDILWLWHAYGIHSEAPDSLLLYNKKALDAYLRTDDLALISKAYRNVGFSLYDLGKFEESEQHFFKALAAAENLNSEEEIASCYAGLSIVYSGTKDFVSALQYSQKVIIAYKEQERTHPLIRALVNQSDIYVHLNEPDKALTDANNALALVADLPERFQKSETANVRAWRGKAYVALEQYDEALEDFLFSWKVVEDKYGVDMANGWKGDIGNVYYLKGDCQEAIPYLRDYVHHHDDKRIQVPGEVKKANLNLAECYKQRNRYDSAFIYLNRGKDMEINTLSEELAALNNELRIEYDTEQKEATIATQSSLIQQQRRSQYLSFGIAGLLVVLLGGLYYTFRNNRRSNRQLQELNDDLEETNTQLDQRNAQNELLLKEIHHRVKNNLETVSSLLELQSAQLEDANAQSVMQASQSRVQSMSIIHQKLYQGENLASIEMRDYFHNLGDSLLDTFDAWEQVTLTYDMPEMELDVDTAIPLGLIVNELLTNSLKYAFPDGEKGTIRIQLQRQSGHTLHLQISDNGVGKQAGLSPKGTGFGSQLVQLLTRQLNGSMQESSKKGLITSLTFRAV